MRTPLADFSTFASQHHWSWSVFLKSAITPLQLLLIIRASTSWEACWRPRLSFCGRSAHFSVELAVKRTSLCTTIPLQPERTFLPQPHASPSVSPRDQGTMWMLTRWAPPQNCSTSHYSWESTLCCQPQILHNLSGSQSRSTKCHKQFAWTETVVLIFCGL